MQTPTVWPPFRPHWLVPGGDLQTLVGALLPGPRWAYTARQHVVSLPDGDRLILHDDLPAAWRAGDITALMVHGLGGCHASGYMQRIAARLNARGVRTFRLDLRGCGAGTGVAQWLYHAGRSEDVDAALQTVARLCPGSPLKLIGFSLGANIVLKLLGELADAGPARVAAAMAVNPPLDLARCARHLLKWRNRIYDRFFAKLLWGQMQRRRKLLPHAPAPPLWRRPKTLLEFDELVTAPLAGYRSADDYYERCSARRVIAQVRTPTVVLTSADDPVAPLACFEGVAWSPATELHVTRGGGHLGYYGRDRNDPDRRWLDWRVTAWATASGE